MFHVSLKTSCSLAHPIDCDLWVDHRQRQRCTRKRIYQWSPSFTESVLPSPLKQAPFTKFPHPGTAATRAKESDSLVLQCDAFTFHSTDRPKPERYAPPPSDLPRGSSLRPPTELRKRSTIAAYALVHMPCGQSATILFFLLAHIASLA